MRKTIAVATFVALGAGTLGVGATDVKGSDTLNAITEALVRDVLPLCPGASTVTYLAGGSGAGETGLTTGAQRVAPMSRFLATTAAVCAAGGPQAEGIAFAVDGLSVLASQGLAIDHQTACDPLADQDAAADCIPTTAPTATGLRYSAVITLPGGGTYTPNNWRDVLRNVYFGLTNTDGASPAQSARNCSDPVRLAIVNSWGNLFENSCAVGDCTELRHAFRRDENSGTTDVFRELLQVNASASTGSAGFPFCNEYVPTVDTAPTCPASTVLAATPGDPPNDPISGAPGFPTAPYFENYQDSDPVRRACAGTNNRTFPANNPPVTTTGHEQVCGARGSLGVVIPISVPQEVPDADRYPTAYCTTGLTTLGAAPRIGTGWCNTDGVGGDDDVSAIGGAGVLNSFDRQNRWALCPNGDMPGGANWDPTRQVACGGSGSCKVPAVPSSDANPAADPRCLNAKNNWVTESNQPAATFPVATCNVPAAVRDGRVYNLHARTRTGTYVTQSYTFNGASAARSVVGAFYRIHTTRTLLTGSSGCVGENCCKLTDATQQIGCLVQASPCSIGFAGREATLSELNSLNTPSIPGAFGVSINAVNPANPACLTAPTPNNYPLSRPLYINSIVGFNDAAVPADQFALAQCFAGTGLAAGTTLPGLLATYDFIPLNAGPCCKDFIEGSCPTPQGASDACATNVNGIPATACPF